MARTPRIPAPSALDGYRRLERTRRVAGVTVPAGAARTLAPTAEATPRVPASRRLAGTLRLGAFLAVIGVIVATSVGLASADSRAGDAKLSTRAAAPAAPAAPTGARIAEARAQAAAKTRAAVKPKARVKARPKARPKAVRRARTTRARRAGTKRAAPAAAAVARTSTATATTPPAAAAPATQVHPRRALPLTGEPAVDWVLLGGACLVLLGMLVQIAGQPLPARRAVR